MRRCPNCRERLAPDEKRRGARCPSCSGPLYVDEEPRRRGEKIGQCAVHPENSARATCPRCGNYLCALCRTLLHGHWLCVACVDRAFEANEGVPGEATAHLRQALLALILGVVSWMVFVVAGIIVFAGMESQNPILLGMGGLAVFTAPIPAVLGLGQAAAAIYTRGDQMVLATLGLILCGLNVGMLVGLMGFSLALN